MTDKLTEAKNLFHQGMEKIKEYELLEEARRRYPIGTKYKSIQYQRLCVVKKEFTFNKTLLEEFITDGNGGSVYINDEWAEIIPEEEKKEKRPPRKFKVGDKVSVCFNANTGHKKGTIGEISDLSPWCGSDYKENEGWSYWVISSDEEWCHMEFHLEPFQEKSLHDQIKEGGWKKVIELVKSPTGYFKYSTILDINLCDIEADKGNAYYKLRALSKVLNEGKEKPEQVFTVKYRDHDNKLFISKNYDTPPPIEFFYESDAGFALKFAEKEWKIFYNSNQ